MTRRRVREFVVVEDEWLRGRRTPDGNTEDGHLLRTGYRCCMGFLAQACGIPDGDCFVGCFADLQDSAWRLLPWPLRPSRLPKRASSGAMESDTKLADDIYTTNDDPRLADEERKLKLTELFSEAGIAVTFVATRQK